jgi:hypothetical protein
MTGDRDDDPRRPPEGPRYVWPYLPLMGLGHVPHDARGGTPGADGSGRAELPPLSQEIAEITALLGVLAGTWLTILPWARPDGSPVPAAVTVAGVGVVTTSLARLPAPVPLAALACVDAAVGLALVLGPVLLVAPDAAGALRAHLLVAGLCLVATGTAGALCGRRPASAPGPP